MPEGVGGKGAYLALEGLRRKLGAFSLDIPELGVEEGRTFVLLGPTGAGKSQLLATIAGFARQDAGKMWLEGRRIEHLPPEARRVGIVFQQPRLFPHLDVAGNIRFGARDRRLFDHLVELLELGPHLEKDPSVLSGGERQLTAVARALMVRPRALLLDEPLGAVDRQSRGRAVEALRRLRRELGITMLMVTHNFEEALQLGQGLGILMGGRLIQSGEPADVFARPASPEAARFLGARNLYAGRVAAKEGSRAQGDRFGAWFESEGVRLHVLAEREGPAYALIQPEEITLSRRRHESSALNQFKGRIEKAERGTALVELRVRSGLVFWVYITPQSMRALELEEGSVVHLAFKASSVRVFSG